MIRIESPYGAVLLLIIALVVQGVSTDLLEARTPSDQARATNQKSAQYHLARGRKLIDRGMYAGAVRSLTRALKKRPNSAEAYLLRGKAYDKMGAPARAVRDLSQYIRLKPSDPIGYIRRGDAKNFSSMHKEALDDYSTAIRLSPSSTAAFLGRGLAYTGMEQYTEAMKDYNWVLRLDPGNQEVLANMGVASMLADRPLQAVTYFEKALAVETNPRWRRRIHEWIEHIVHYPGAKHRRTGGPTRAPKPRPRPMW